MFDILRFASSISQILMNGYFGAFGLVLEDSVPERIEKYWPMTNVSDLRDNESRGITFLGQASQILLSDAGGVTIDVASKLLGC